MDRIVFLSIVISARDVKVDKEKAKIIKEWLTPTKTIEVTSFHSLTSFY